MTRKSHFDPQRVREEIAIAAARMIAEDGLDYSTAKRKAARQLVGETHVSGEWLPDNDQIEEEIREYQAIFQGDSQPAVLRRLRGVALDWMQRLAAFNPYLTGAVLNGTAGEHSDVYLQAFCDNPKEVAIYFLNANIQYDVSETRHFAGRGYVETLSFMWRPEREGRDSEPVGVHVALYDANDLRGAVRADARGRYARASAQAVQALVDGSSVEGRAENRAASPNN
ncbi:UDP-N-acetylmuramate--alanine ligase [Paraburkholderia sp. DHOC27]|uniref:UDP-N-acetylmuramate--alanine ligase n=1 Tax=Paraburkholderia sp. DHOC27 TaxID=2303330 RepID=UPI000E3CCD00|nr:UDP-N-acetylmuramate--alanine ligase [Paraburkholderia sp. DHOC27]RFU45774.1 UDP-N-acetylmuramate--alanine ligase [Paraburkholderia sp. DHOC27]